MTGLPTADMTLVALLDTREFLSDPDHWMQGGLYDAARERFCLLGYASMHWHSYVCDYLNQRARAEFGDSENGELVEAAKFNDTHSHAEVVAFLDRAIAAWKP